MRKTGHIAATLLCGLAVGTAAYVGAGSLATRALAALPVKAAEIKGDSDGIEALKKAQKALGTAKFYRVHSVVTTEDNKTTERTIEVIPPDRYHFIDERMEMIILPDGTYQKNRGKWMKFPMDMHKMTDQMKDPKIIDELGIDMTVKSLGAAVLDGVPTQTFEVTYSGKDIKGVSKWWLRKSDSLPLKAENDGETKKTRFFGKSVGGKSKTVNTYDYITPVKIEAPA